MTTPIEHQQLNAFVDGELDLKSQVDIERQLENHVALRRQVDEMLQLREVVREKANYHSAPAVFKRRMTALMASSPERPVAPAPARASTIGEAVRQWLGVRQLAASLSFAAVLAVSVNLAWLQSSTDERLTDDVVASHVRATLGQHLVDVSSSDHHTVKPFLSSKLGFSPPVHELHIPGSVLIGGRVDYLDGRPVAAFVYQQGQHIVDAFAWPSNGPDSNPKFSAERGYLTAHWSHNGMNHWVISDVNREEFRTVVSAIAMADVDR